MTARFMLWWQELTIIPTRSSARANASGEDASAATTFTRRGSMAATLRAVATSRSASTRSMPAGAVSARSRIVMRPIAPAPPTTAIRVRVIVSLRNLRSALPVGEPERLSFGDEVEVHVLGLPERVEALLAELSAHAALAHAAERRGIVVRERVVDPERAGLDLLHRRQCPREVLR